MTKNRNRTQYDYFNRAFNRGIEEVYLFEDKTNDKLRTYEKPILPALVNQDKSSCEFIIPDGFYEGEVFSANKMKNSIRNSLWGICERAMYEKIPFQANGEMKTGLEHVPVKVLGVSTSNGKVYHVKFERDKEYRTVMDKLRGLKQIVAEELRIGKFSEGIIPH